MSVGQRKNLGPHEESNPRPSDSNVEIANPSHMQDMCYMNFTIDHVHLRVSVAQW